MAETADIRTDTDRDTGEFIIFAHHDGVRYLLRKVAQNAPQYHYVDENGTERAYF